MLMTIGHSTLDIDVFLGALVENGCEMLVDVRRFPGSRRYPQFAQEALFRSLDGVGIEAEWREGLGGRRRPRADSENLGWRNESFRGYADYMLTAEFAAELDWLIELVGNKSAVVMCAEAVPWRCHRSLIGDAVLARGGRVEDIFVTAAGSSSRKTHQLASFAQVKDGQVCYPGE
jgi:uncharacterized protein (DUF488 family)